MNQYTKYWIEKPVKWHEYEIGIYHISAIGIGHQELEPEEHSGPCLRSLYGDYLRGEEESKGVFQLGNILHAELQRIYKINHPNSVFEFPLVFTINNSEGNPILLKGSVDLIDFDLGINPDIKTAGLFTFPKGEYDINPTYAAQVDLYTYILMHEVFRPDWYRATMTRIITVKKHDLDTLEQDHYMEDYNVDAYIEFESRVLYFDDCLRNKKLPDAEPHKWCKYCDGLDNCIERGDIIKIKDGRKTRYLKNE